MPTTPDTLPAEVVDFLARLVYEPKRDYARKYALHRCHGAPAPDDPGADWARKARVRIDRYTRETVR